MTEIEYYVQTCCMYTIFCIYRGESAIMQLNQIKCFKYYVRVGCCLFHRDLLSNFLGVVF